jgi:hypothetical protein
MHRLAVNDFIIGIIGVSPLRASYPGFRVHANTKENPAGYHRRGPVFWP